MYNLIPWETKPFVPRKKRWLDLIQHLQSWNNRLGWTLRTSVCTHLYGRIVVACLSYHVHTNADVSIVRLHLCNHRPERVDTPRSACTSILRISRHGIGDGSWVAIDPMSVLNIMTVGALVSTFRGMDHVCPECFDPRKWPRYLPDPRQLD